MNTGRGKAINIPAFMASLYIILSFFYLCLSVSICGFIRFLFFVIFVFQISLCASVFCGYTR